MTPAPAPGAGFRLLAALYHDEPMISIWSQEQTVETWLQVESALAQAQAEVEVIDQKDADAVSAACRLDTIDAEALWKGARTVGYPILPLVRQVSEALPPGPDGRVHYGATTQDIMDTTLALQLGRSCDRLLDLSIAFGDALAVLTRAQAMAVMAARTHAQQAVPTTFGAKAAVFLAEVGREVRELHRVGVDVRVVSLFGAGGTGAAMGERAPDVRRALANRLGLSDSDVPWHVARDRVARFGQVCALLAATSVRFAREVVDLSRTEIAEVREQDGHHRGASSTMPQKVNPISSESVIGYGVAASASAALLLRAMEAGHERSAGEWQIEWLAVPQVSEYTAAALSLSANTASALQVFPETMRRNLDRDVGLLMSEALMMQLAPLLGRERAHDVIYAAVVEARATGEDLVSVCARTLPEDVRSSVGPLDRGAADYIGEAPAVVAAAVRGWEATRQKVTTSRASSGGDR